MTLNRSRATSALTLTTLALSTSGCAAIEGIFKAGVWTGVIAVFVVLALLIWGVKSLLT
jgi:hypothetical protein